MYTYICRGLLCDQVCLAWAPAFVHPHNLSGLPARQPANLPTCRPGGLPVGPPACRPAAWPLSTSLQSSKTVKVRSSRASISSRQRLVYAVNMRLPGQLTNPSQSDTDRTLRIPNMQTPCVTKGPGIWNPARGSTRSCSSPRGGRHPLRGEWHCHRWSSQCLQPRLDGWLVGCIAAWPCGCLAALPGWWLPPTWLPGLVDQLLWHLPSGPGAS